MARTGPAPGSTFWHRYNRATDSWEEICVKPNENPPDDTWKWGHRPKSMAARMVVSELHTGKIVSDETKKKMSLAKIGVPKSEAHKAAMSAALKHRFAKGGIQ